MKFITAAMPSQRVWFAAFLIACALHAAALVAGQINAGPVIDLSNIGYAPNVYFGSATAVENDTAVVVGLKPGGYGIVWAYRRNGSSWTLTSQLEALGVNNTQGFGNAIALSGDTIVVLSRPSTVTTAISIFARGSNGAWVPQQTITQSDWPISAVTSVALSGDTLCLGSPTATPPKSTLPCGVVDVFARNGVTWSFQKTLAPSDPQRSERFGAAIALDSGRLAVGTPAATVGKVRYCGACYVFNRTGDTWKQTAKIIDPSPQYAYQFGGSVALSLNCLLIGSPARAQLVGSPTRPYTTVKGSVHSFTFNTAGKWVFEGLLPPPAYDPDPTVVASPQALSQKIALSGSIAVVSNPTLLPTTERSYIYQHRGGRWIQITPLIDNGFDLSTWDPAAYDPSAPPLFNLTSSPGGVPSVSGNTIVIGSPSEFTSAGIHSGAAHFYTFTGSPLTAFDGATLMAPELIADTPGHVPVLMNDMVLNRAKKRSFTLQNLGTTTLTNLTFTVDNPDVTLSPSLIPSLAPMASATLTLTINPTVDGPWEAFLVARSGATTLLTLDLQTNIYDVATPPVIMADPVSAALRVGATYEISADVIGTEPLTYQWYRDGRPCPHCNSRTLTLTPVSLAQKGVYELLVTNEGGSAFSGPADIAVYGVQAPLAVKKNEGNSLTLTTPVALAPGSGSIAVNWFLNGLPLRDDPANDNIRGSTKPTLTIKKLGASTSGQYTAVLTTATETVTAGTWNVSVLLRPVVQSPATRPISMSVVSTLTMHLTSTPAATSFVFRNLPPGIRAETRTGTLSGRPTVPGSYQVQVAGVNAAGTGAAQTIAINVMALDSHAVGQFQGIVGRDPGNGGLGGMVTLTNSANGTCTGVVTAGTRTARFTTSLQFKPDGTPCRADITAVFGTISDHYVLDIDTASGKLTGSFASTLSPGTGSAIDGWNNPWSKLAPATLWSDYLTIALSPPAGLAGIPAGRSVGTASISVNGTVAWAGRMADGSVTTATGLISPTQTDHVEMPLRFALNSGKGSAQGVLTISQSNPSSPSRHSAAGALDWFKLPVPSRSYAAGISLHALTAEGGPYAPPLPGNVILGLPVAFGNAQLVYAGAGIESAFQFPLLSQPFTITFQNLAQFPLPDFVADVLAINIKTGVFTGSAQLNDPSPANPLINVRRTVSTYGVLRNSTGQGYFTLPDLPDPTAHPATTPATSPIESGSVVLQAAE